MYTGLKISVSEASDKMSDVFGVGSDIVEMMSGTMILVSVCGKLDLEGMVEGMVEGMHL